MRKQSFLPSISLLLAITVSLAVTAAARAQTINGIPVQGGEPKKISGDLALVSPSALCWDGGALYFADVNIEKPQASRTYRMNPGGAIEMLRENNGIVTAIRGSGKGTFYCAELAGHRVVETDRAGTVLGVVADNYKGTAFEGPIDLAMDARGGLYFTDTPYYFRTINYIDTHSGVYYRSPEGQITRVVESVVCPWTMAFSPDRATMYLAFIGGDDSGRTMLAYDVQPDGSLRNAKKFGTIALSNQNDVLELTWKSTTCKPSNPASSGAAGMAVDTAGNVYLATNQGLGIVMYSPAGARLGAIAVGLAVNDCCFGGPDMKTLFIAANEGIFSIPAQVAGMVAGVGK